VKVSAIVRVSRVPAKEADKVPAKEGCSSSVQAELTRGKRERESPNTEKYKCGGPKQGHDFSKANSTDRATQE